jgi:hypothetical protein
LVKETAVWAKGSGSIFRARTAFELFGSTTILGGHKSEIRNPKPETNPKQESRNGQNRSGLGGFGH